MFCKWRVHSSLSLQTVHLLPEQRQGDCSQAGEETGVGDEVPAPGSRDTPHRRCLGSEREAGCAHTHVPVSEAERKGNIPSLLAGVGHRWGGPGHTGHPEDLRAARLSHRVPAARKVAAASRGQKRGHKLELGARP